MTELGLDSTRQLPHVRISSNTADIGHSSAALQLFYSQLTKSQVSQSLISCSPAVLLTAYQVSGISVTHQLLSSCSTHSSPSPRYLSYLSASNQLFFLTAHQVSGTSAILQLLNSLFTAHQVSGTSISATRQLLSSCSTYSSQGLRYTSNSSAAEQLFYSLLTRSQVHQPSSAALQPYQPLKLLYS
jgi:hypothetical protein